MTNSSGDPFPFVSSSNDTGTDYRVLLFPLSSTLPMQSFPSLFSQHSAELPAASIGDVCGVFAICISTTFKAVP